MVKKKYYFIILLTLLLCSCAVDKEARVIPIVDKDLITLDDKFGPLLFDNDCFIGRKTLYSVYQMLKNQNYNTAKNYLDSLSKSSESSSELNFSFALYYSVQGQFEKAKDYIDKVDTNDYKNVRNLLCADINADSIFYHANLSGGAPTIGVINAIKGYQICFDKSVYDTNFKKIINYRVNFFKYNYKELWEN